MSAARSDADAPRRIVAILVGIATLFVLVQFLTASLFIRAHGGGAETWQEIHGYTAYGVLAFSLAAALVAVFTRLRSAAPFLTVLAVLFFLATVGQWGSGHLISQFGQDGWTPFHVFFSSIVLILAVWVAIRSARPRRA